MVGHCSTMWELTWMVAGFPALLNALRLIKVVGICSRKGLGIGSMIGVIVGFVGKPTPISGVSEDLSTGVEEDMIDAERRPETPDNDVGELEMLTD